MVDSCEHGNESSDSTKWRGLSSIAEVIIIFSRRILPREVNAWNGRKI
jgi:hypothetical protein